MVDTLRGIVDLFTACQPGDTGSITRGALLQGMTRIDENYMSPELTRKIPKDTVETVSHMITPDGLSLTFIEFWTMMEHTISEAPESGMSSESFGSHSHR
jgi:hypothetical protein